jgi:hypothetical protein
MSIDLTRRKFLKYALTTMAAAIVPVVLKDKTSLPDDLICSTMHEGRLVYVRKAEPQRVYMSQVLDPKDFWVKEVGKAYGRRTDQLIIDDINKVG